MESMKGLVIVCTNGALRSCQRGLYPAIDNQVIHEDMSDVLAGLKSEGWGVIGVCNQGGISIGKKSLEDTIAEFMQMLLMCPFMDAAMFCPSMPSPNPHHESLLELVLLEQGDILPTVTQFGCNGYDDEFFEDGIPRGSDKILLKGYDEFCKPGIGMVQFALNYFQYGAEATKKGLYNSSYTSGNQSRIVSLVREVVGVGERAEDFQAFKTAGVNVISRDTFVIDYGKLVDKL